MAVGHYDPETPAAPTLTLAEVWNGTRWRIVPTPLPVGHKFNELYGVACTTPVACLAVGDTAPEFDTHDRPLAESWNGSQWALQRIPAPIGPARSDLRGMACASETACVAIGGFHDDNDAFSEVWDGTAWKIKPVPQPEGTISSYLVGASCSGPSACTAVGGYQKEFGVDLTLVERWDGRSWSVQDSPNQGSLGSELYDVSCPSPTWCAAVGYSMGHNPNCEPPNTCPLTLAESWDGTTWTVDPTPAPPRHVFWFSLTGVSCTSPTSCTAVGNRTILPYELPFAETWDGSTWSLQHMPPDRGGDDFIFMNSISCTAPRACAAVGSDVIKTFAEVE